MALFKHAAPGLDGAKVDTLIGAEAFFQGVLTVKGSVRIDGRVEGAIAGARSVIVGSAGAVKGDVTADVVVVGGKVHGDVAASEQIELLARSQVTGDLRTPSLIIEEGSLFDGACQMTSKKNPAAAAARTPASKAEGEAAPAIAR